MSPLRLWLRNLGVARIDWAYNHYSDTYQVHDVRVLDDAGKELSIELPMHHISSYLREVTLKSHFGAFSWSVLENEVLDVGGCKPKTNDTNDDQVGYEVFWSESIPQIRVAQGWTAADGIPLLEALINSDDPFVRLAVKENPNIPPAQKEILMGDLDEIFWIRDEDDDWLKHKARKEEIAKAKMPQLAEFASSLLAVDRYAVAKNPETPAGLLDQLAADSAWQVRLAVAVNPNTDTKISQQIMRVLAGLPSDWIRYQLACHEDCPTVLLERLAKDRRAMVQFKVLAHQNCTLECLQIVLRHLPQDSEWHDVIENAILEHPLVSPEIVQTFWASQNGYLQRNALKIAQKRFGLVFDEVQNSTPSILSQMGTPDLAYSLDELSVHLKDLEKASSADTPQAELSHLVQRAFDVLQIIAASPHTNESIVEKILQSISGVYYRLGRTQVLSYSSQKKLILEGKANVLQHRQDLSVEALDLMLSQPNLHLAGLATNPFVPAQILERLCEMGWSQDVIQNPNAPLHLLVKYDSHGFQLLKNKHATSQDLARIVGKVVLEKDLEAHPNCPKELLESCRELAKKAATTKEPLEMEQYAKNEWEQVRLALAGNPFLSASILHHFLQDSSWNVRRKTSIRLGIEETNFERSYNQAPIIPLDPHLTEAELNQIAQTTELYLRFIKPILEHPQISVQVLETLLTRDGNYAVAEALCYFPLTTASMLERISEMPFVMTESEQMMQVLKHPNVSEKILMAYSLDDRLDIRLEAQQRLLMLQKRMRTN